MNRWNALTFNQKLVVIVIAMLVVYAYGTYRHVTTPYAPEPQQPRDYLAEYGGMPAFYQRVRMTTDCTELRDLRDLSIANRDAAADADKWPFRGYALAAIDRLEELRC